MPSKWKKGWKVVRKNSRYSAVVHDAPGGRCYKKGITVGRARGYGPLCVYETRASARDFARDFARDDWFHSRRRSLEIVKCLYIPSKHKEIWSGDISYSLRALPTGTALAEKVMCLE